MDFKERNLFTRLGLAGAQPSSSAEDEEEGESAISEGSPSEEREGTTWGGEAGGDAGGATGGAVR